jgi:hypothetical protein
LVDEGPFTVRSAPREVVPWPLVELLNVMVALCDPVAKALAFEFTVKVTIVGVVVSVPAVEDAESQLGRPLIE